MASPGPIMRRAPYHDSEGRLRLPINCADTPGLMPSAGVQAILDATATAASPDILVALGEAEFPVAERLLALAASPLLGIGRVLGDVPGALRQLGAPALRDAALLVTMDTIASSSPSPSFDVGRYLEDAAVRATVTFAVARVAGYESPREAYTASLLQDFGVVVMGLLCPDKAGQIEICQERPAAERILWERAIFGGSHAEVFEAYGRAWRLPPGMARAVSSHHDEVIALPDRRTQRLAELLRLADAVADLCQVGGSEPNLARARTKVAALRSRSPLTLRTILMDAVAFGPELARASGTALPPVCTLEEVIGAPTKAPPTIRAVRGYGARGPVVTGERTLRVEQLQREKEHLARELRVNRTRVTLLSRVDPVTGASSRRELCRLLDKLIAEPTRSTTLCVFLVELEDAVATGGGGAEGNLLLREVAERLHGTLRGEDVIGRIGSDTPAFGLLLPDCTAADGPRVARRLLERAQGGTVSATGEAPIEVYIGGTAITPGVEAEVEDIVAACERAVEDARRAGDTVGWSALE